MGTAVVVPARQARQPMGGGRLPHAAGGMPILALDMYEHSYHMDYGAKAADYVGAFMAAINWSAVRRIKNGLRD